MKRKFCLTPNPSQAGLDIPSVPKVTERLRDIHLDRDTCAQSYQENRSPSIEIAPASVAAARMYRTPVDGRHSSSSTDSKEDQSPGYPDDVFDEIEFTCRSPSSSYSLSLGRDDLETITRMRSSTITPGEEITNRKLPTVFRWEGGGKNIYLSGSFDGWKTKIPMVKSHEDFYTIVELPEGEHQFKYHVDNQWVCDTNLTQMDNDLGSKNNCVTVNASDFEVFEALAMDSSSAESMAYNSKTGMAGSPQGEYSQSIPSRNTGTGFHHSGPPILPPHLLQVILNKEIPLHCEPTLLPEPNHVMLNHLYALSIKDGVMVLSATHRYRKKYVTTLLYKPI